MDRQQFLDWLQRDCERSGVPLKVEDPVVLRRLVVMLTIAEQAKGRKR